MVRISGIYKIVNLITGDSYIGSSKNIMKRWANHRSPSAWAYQSNSKLYIDMIEFGLNNFTFEIIEETDNLLEREQYWVDQLKPSYNVRRAKLDSGIKKEAQRRYQRKYYKNHREECLDYYKVNRNKMQTYSKAWHKAHRIKHLDRMKAYRNKLCLYEGEILTLNALSARFYRQGIAHAMLEAKKYLI